MRALIHHFASPRNGGWMTLAFPIPVGCVTSRHRRLLKVHLAVCHRRYQAVPAAAAPPFRASGSRHRTLTDHASRSPVRFRSSWKRLMKLR